MALRAGATYDTCLLLLRRIRARYPALPIGLLLYYNLLHMRGDKAYVELADIGVDAVVCSDLPYEESTLHMKSLSESGLGCIQMIAPNTPMNRASKLLNKSSAFTYVISRFGTTGTSEHFEDEDLMRIASISCISTQPIVVGFGISKVEQVVEFWQRGANGVIIGSLFSLYIENNLQDLLSVANYIEDFITKVQCEKVNMNFKPEEV